MKDLIFACMLGSDKSEIDALRLARSIRTFGGEYCFNPIWMLTPRSEADLPAATREELYAIGARLVSFEADPDVTPFPFRSYVTAAGIAEGLAQGQASFLVLMGPDTLVLHEPSAFRLPARKSFGGCPVHLKLLGSSWGEPPDAFWSLIYHQCQVDEGRVFSMTTVVDQLQVLAYFHAGLLVVRPERGLLRSWQASFERLYRLAEFEPFYQQSELYEIFMHQAVLAGSLLAALRPDEFQLLPGEVNYPLHLHARVAEGQRPASIGKLITCRYEEYAVTFRDPHVQAFFQTDLPLKDWLKTQAG